MKGQALQFSLARRSLAAPAQRVGDAGCRSSLGLLHLIALKIRWLPSS
jgi:hypothetical protein